MKTIILYGEMAKRFGKYHRFAVKNVAEAIRALRVNHKGFETYMCSAHQHGVGFRVLVGEASLDLNEIHNPTGVNEKICFIPAVAGAGDGMMKILVGVALIAASVLATPLGIGFLATPLLSAGIGLTIGGIAQLLTPTPTINQPGSNGETPSFIFSGAENTSAQGSPIPVGYGRMIVGSVVVSAGIRTHETT